MQVSKKIPNKQIRKQSAPKGEVTAKKPEGGSVVRDVVATGAGIVAGTAGGVYGGVEGLIKGGIENYPKHVKTGAKLGKKILTPVGGASGAIATGVATTVAAVGAPVVAALSVGVGAVAGTGIGAVKNLPSSVVETGKKGAEAGKNLGSGLGKVGETVGKYAGAVLGGVAGLAVSVARGLPEGGKLAKSEFKAGVDLVKNVPKFAKDTWNIAYNGGRDVAGGLGSLAGGSAGLITATADTGIDGAANAVKRGAQWGTATHGYIKGES